MVLALAFVSYFRLSSSFISNWDEAFYADGIRSLLRTGEVVVPYWNQEVFLDKPPLHLWTASLGRLLVGDSSAGYRFSSATSTFFTLVLVFGYCQKKYGWLPALMAVGCLAANDIFIWRGRGSNTDGLLTLLVTLTFVIYDSSFKWKYAALGFVLSLVYMTKATVVMFPILSLGLLELLDIGFKWRQIKWSQKATQWLQGLLALIALPALWLTLGYQKLGFDFIEFYLWQSDYQASGLGLQFFNLVYIRALVSSWGWFLIPVVGGVALALLNWRNSSHRVLLAFSLPMILALSFSPVHYHWYLMPTLPIFAILAGYGAFELLRRYTYRWIPYLLVIWLILFGGQQFHSQIWPLFYDNAAYHQAQSGLWLEANTASNDIVVRLDEVYPTVIFYSDRRVLVSTVNSETKSYFLSRRDLIQGLQAGKFKWVSGPQLEVATLANSLPNGSYVTHQITDSESVLEMVQPKVIFSEPQ